MVSESNRTQKGISLRTRYWSINFCLRFHLKKSLTKVISVFSIVMPFENWIQVRIDTDLRNTHFINASRQVKSTTRLRQGYQGVPSGNLATPGYTGCFACNADWTISDLTQHLAWTKHHRIHYIPTWISNCVYCPNDSLELRKWNLSILIW